MGDLRPRGDDQSPEDEGVRRPVPDLPPEWGEVIIPDDAAELDAEATALRRELGRGPFRRTMTGHGHDASLAVPFAIISIALVITLISLFMVTWGRAPDPTGPPTRSPTTPASPASSVPGSSWSSPPPTPAGTVTAAPR